MSNAGKRVLNWKRDFPTLRIALGILGKDGWSSAQAAHFLLWHEQLKTLRKHYASTTGRELGAEVLQSRMRKSHEIVPLKESDPRSYRKGLELSTLLEEDLKKARIMKVSL